MVRHIECRLAQAQELRLDAVVLSQEVRFDIRIELGSANRLVSICECDFKVPQRTISLCQQRVNAKQHRQWLSDLETFKSSLRAQGAEPKALEYVNEAFGRLAERIKKLAG